MVTHNTHIPRVTTNPAIAHGQPVIRDTRIPVAVLVGHVAAGDAINDIAADYQIPMDDVLAAIAYACECIHIVHPETHSKFPD